MKTKKIITSIAFAFALIFGSTVMAQDSKMEKRSFGNNESTIKGTEIHIMMPHFIPPDLMIITVIIILLFSFTL